MGGGKFGHSEKLIREQFAVMMARVLDETFLPAEITIPSTSGYLSATQAHSFLSSSGAFNKNVGHRYTYNETNRNVITVSVGSGHVTSIYYEGGAYKTYTSGTLDMYIEQFGEEFGKELYDGVQLFKGEIESVVRAAADAVYGPGTAKANALYNELISNKFTQSKTF